MICRDGKWVPEPQHPAGCSHEKALRRSQRRPCGPRTGIMHRRPLDPGRPWASRRPVSTQSHMEQLVQNLYFSLANRSLSSRPRSTCGHAGAGPGQSPNAPQVETAMVYCGSGMLPSAGGKCQRLRGEEEDRRDQRPVREREGPGHVGADPGASRQTQGNRPETHGVHIGLHVADRSIHSCAWVVGRLLEPRG